MDLKSYIDLEVLLRTQPREREARRSFGLAHASLSPEDQLQAWREKHLHTLPTPRLSDRIDHFLYGVSITLLIVALLLGILTGVGLLRYNGSEPVNLIYFLAIAVLIPLVSMGLSMIAMLRANRAKNLLVHLSMAFWMERIVALWSKESADALQEVRINPLVANWIVIKRSQSIALAFSIGLLLALLGVVATQDVAFAWSTTLDLSAEGFYRFLHTLAWPWRAWLPDAVPSLSLVEQSRYFRLGGGVSDTLIAHASLLGAWWKFLAMATLFYAVLLRLLLWIVSAKGLTRALHTALMSLDGAKQLLSDMNEPYITTHEQEEDKKTPSTEPHQPSVAHKPVTAYDMVQGWSLDEDRLRFLCDHFDIEAPVCFHVGGNNTLEADEKVIEESSGSVVLFVKAWEPPTMDAVDHIMALIPKVERLVIWPIGLEEDGYVANPRSVAVWVRKLTPLINEKVWIVE